MYTITMISTVSLVIIFYLPTARAGGWDDFSNNLATDLAPFLSLFGEQVTKQYLSESLTFLDYFIFAMAPIGILTAVVSAIRVCGGPSLRAFIGRAQEGVGNAEAELCSSTSRDVCELYHNGGIARVFGRPKILEVIFDRDSQDPGTVGIYTFQEYLKEKGKDKWTIKRRSNDTESAPQKLSPTTAFAPNLSLNLGITKQHPVFFWTAALGGLTLQSGVLVFAVIVTYYLRWDKNGSSPDSYACPLTVIGTLLVCGGMFWCAFVIGQSTDEVVWRRQASQEINDTSVHWVQPGGQIIGDQTFDAFSCADCDDSKGHLKEYTTSWKRSDLKNWRYRVWAAAGITISGFVCQFIGLRGIHSAVAVAQLGVIMVMSIARAALRMRRLTPDANAFAEYPDEVIGHELDWLAFRIGEKDIQQCLFPPRCRPTASLLSKNKYRYSWKFCGTFEPKTGSQNEDFSDSDEPNIAAKLFTYRTRLAQLTESPSTQPKSARSPQNFEIEMVEVRRMAEQLASAMEMTINTISSRSAKIGEKCASIHFAFDCEVSAKRVENSNGSDDNGISCLPAATSSRNTLSMQLNGGSTSPWGFRDKLEALLGLWLWSLKSDPAFETKDRQNGLRVFRAAESPIRRIISTSRKMAEMDLKIWLNDRVSIATEEELQSGSTKQNNPSTIWKRKRDDVYEPLPEGIHLPEELRSNLHDRTIRYYGWYAVVDSQTQMSEPFKVCSVPVSGSLLSACTWEIFGSFVKCIVGVVDDIGSIQIKEDEVGFRVENRLVSEILKSFGDNQLGSESDGLLCILPALLPRLRMPSSDSALITAVKTANQHRRKKEYGKAEDILKWAWKTCSPSFNHSQNETSETENLTKVAVVALGDLYRCALRDADSESFGATGIDWLKKQKSGSGLSRTSFLDQVIDRYGKIQEMTPISESSAEIDLVSAVKDGDLEEALIFLTQKTIKLPNAALCNGVIRECSGRLRTL